MASSRSTVFILGGLIVGLASGHIAHAVCPQHAATFADLTALLASGFLRLIKMIIGPLVFSTLVVGIGRLGDVLAVGRIGAKALVWFALASVISLSLGLVLVNVLEPGNAARLALPGSDAVASATGEPLSLQTFLVHAIPTSAFDALARNEILQIVVFSLFFGTAMASLGSRAENILAPLETLSHIMLRVTGYVMALAPLAVFGASAALVAREGLGILGVYGLFVGEFYIGVALLWLVLIGLGAAVLRGRIIPLLKNMRAPAMLAFSTASSEVAFPRMLQELERSGVSNRVASFVLPLGYSFNLDGTMLYCTFAVIFIAQCYGIEMPMAQQITLVGVLLVTSKGIAGVPRAALVVVATTLHQFDIPEAGLLLILGIDHFLDMGRSATNVVGNSIATAVVARWEGDADRRAVGEGLPATPTDHRNR